MDINSNNSNNDQLFFKVYRNKFLNTMIYSNLYESFKFKKNNYCQIVSVDWLIENKHMELLKEKVKRNEYLIFTKKLDRIFSNIQDDQEFYQLLFNNYSNQLMFNGLLENDWETFLKSIIYSDCLAALVELMNGNYPILITEDILLYAFKLNSFSTAKYIQNNYNFQIDFNGYLRTMKLHTSTKEFINSKDGLKSMDCKIVNDKTKFLINVLKIEKPLNDSPELVYSLNKQLWKLTIQDLIDTCITISYLSNPLTSCKQSMNEYLNHQDMDKIKLEYSHQLFQEYLNKPNVSLSIDEINSIVQSINLTSSQLSTKLSNIVRSDRQLITSLLLLIQMVLPFINIGFGFFNSFTFYYLHCQPHNLNLVSMDDEMISLILTKFQLIQVLFNFLETNDTQIKSKYLEHLKENTPLINNNMDLPNNILFKLKKLFRKLCDVDGFKYIIDLLGLEETEFNSQLYNLKSIKQLDYLIKNYKNQLFSQFNLHLFLSTNEYESNWFKTTHPIEFKEFIDLNFKRILKGNITINSTVSFSNLFYQYCLESKEAFNQIVPQNTGCLNLDQSRITSKEFNYFFVTSGCSKLIYSIRAIQFEKPISTYENYSLNERLILFYYLIGNYNLMFNSVDNTQQQTQQPQQVYDGEISVDQETSKLFFFENSALCFDFIGKNGDIDALDIILSKYFSEIGLNISFIEYLDPLFYFATFFSQIQIFRFIQSNYPHLLLKSGSLIYNKCCTAPRFTKVHPEIVYFFNQLSINC